MTDLKTLQASWRQKHDEATQIINDEKATGEALIKAEKLFDERDAIAKQIEEVQVEGKRKSALADRARAGTAWDSEPVLTLPFTAAKAQGSDGAFSLKDMIPAGHIKLDPQQRLIEEAGAGTFGEKTWGLLSSFEYKRDFLMYLRKGGRYFTKALQEGLDDQGGVFSPAEFVQQVIGRLPAPTQLRSLVTTLTTGRDTLIMPRKQYSSDDKYTTAFRATWAGEIPSSDTAVAVTDTNLLGNIEINVQTAMLSAAVTKNMIEDSAFPIQTWLSNELSQVIDLLYEDMILNGTGSAQPYGITNNPGGTDRPEVVLSGSAGAISYDGLIDLLTALAPQYDQNARFVMNKKSTMRALYKIKDQNNRPLFASGVLNDGLVEGRGMTLLGYPITFSAFMPDVSSTTYPILFGDLKGYYLAQRVGFSIQVLDQTKAKQNQIELVGRVRFGGKPAEFWRLKLQKSNNA